MYTTCLQSVQKWTLNVYNPYENVHYMFTIRNKRTLNVYKSLKKCTLHVYNPYRNVHLMFTTRTEMHTTCLQSVQKCTLHVYNLYINLHWLFTNLSNLLHIQTTCATSIEPIVSVPHQHGLPVTATGGGGQHADDGQSQGRCPALMVCCDTKYRTGIALNVYLWCISYVFQNCWCQSQMSNAFSRFRNTLVERAFSAFRPKGIVNNRHFVLWGRHLGDILQF